MAGKVCGGYALIGSLSVVDFDGVLEVGQLCEACGSRGDVGGIVAVVASVSYAGVGPCDEGCRPIT